MKRIEKTCEVCQATMSVKAADHARGYGRFCSRSCAATFKAGSRDQKAQDACIKACVLAGLSQKIIAKGLGRSTTHIQNRVKALGLTHIGVVRAAPSFEPIPGETWVDVPDLGIRASSAERFLSLRTGRLLRINTNRSRRMLTVNAGTPRKNTLSVSTIMAIAFGGEAPRRHQRWTAADDAAIKGAETLADAVRALPNRTAKAIKARASLRGHAFVRIAPKSKKVRVSDARRDPARGSVPYLDPLWAEAHAVVPRGLPDHVRDDLISELVLRRLEGGAPDFRTELRSVMKDHHAMMGTWRERSLDAVIPGTDGLRRVDLLTDDCERF